MNATIRGRRNTSRTLPSVTIRAIVELTATGTLPVFRAESEVELTQWWESRSALCGVTAGTYSDLRWGVLLDAGTIVALIVAGPGALEFHQRAEAEEHEPDSALSDPWGNTLRLSGLQPRGPAPEDRPFVPIPPALTAEMHR